MNLSERVLGWVADSGAEGDLIVSEGNSLSLKARDGELEEHKVTSSQVFGVRVIKENRAGVAYSEAADEAALRTMVEQALVNASYARIDAHEHIPDTPSTLQTDDALLAPTDSVSIEEKIDTVLQLESQLGSAVPLSKSEAIGNSSLNYSNFQSGMKRLGAAGAAPASAGSAAGGPVCRLRRSSIVGARRASRVASFGAAAAAAVASRSASLAALRRSRASSTR